MISDMKTVTRFFFLWLLALIAGPSCSLRRQEDEEASIQYISEMSRKLQPSQLQADMLKAQEGSAKAAHRVGCHFVDSRDLMEGLKWLRVASILGFARSQHEFYVQAISFNDLDKATQIEAKLWLEKACATFEPARNCKRNNLEIRGTLDGSGWK